MSENYQDPTLPSLNVPQDRAELTEDWGHSPSRIEEDERVYMSKSPIYGNIQDEDLSQREILVAKLKDGAEQVKSAVANFDKDQALERGKDLIATYPWPATLATFALGALIGHKLFRSS